MKNAEKYFEFSDNLRKNIDAIYFDFTHEGNKVNFSEYSFESSNKPPKLPVEVEWTEKRFHYYQDLAFLLTRSYSLIRIKSQRMETASKEKIDLNVDEKAYRDISLKEGFILIINKIYSDYFEHNIEIPEDTILWLLPNQLKWEIEEEEKRFWRQRIYILQDLANYLKGTLSENTENIEKKLFDKFKDIRAVTIRDVKISHADVKAALDIRRGNSEVIEQYAQDNNQSPIIYVLKQTSKLLGKDENALILQKEPKDNIEYNYIKSLVDEEKLKQVWAQLIKNGSIEANFKEKEYPLLLKNFKEAFESLTDHAKVVQNNNKGITSFLYRYMLNKDLLKVELSKRELLIQEDSDLHNLMQDLTSFLGESAQDELDKINDDPKDNMVQKVRDYIKECLNTREDLPIEAILEILSPILNLKEAGKEYLKKYFIHRIEFIKGCRSFIEELQNGETKAGAMGAALGKSGSKFLDEDKVTKIFFTITPKLKQNEIIGDIITKLNTYARGALPEQITYTKISTDKRSIEYNYLRREIRASSVFTKYNSIANQNKPFQENLDYQEYTGALTQAVSKYSDLLESKLGKKHKDNVTRNYSSQEVINALKDQGIYSAKFTASPVKLHNILNTIIETKKIDSSTAQQIHNTIQEMYRKYFENEKTSIPKTTTALIFHSFRNSESINVDSSFKELYDDRQEIILTIRKLLTVLNQNKNSTDITLHLASLTVFFKVKDLPALAKELFTNLANANDPIEEFTKNINIFITTKCKHAKSDVEAIDKQKYIVEWEYLVNKISPDHIKQDAKKYLDKLPQTSGSSETEVIRHTKSSKELDYIEYSLKLREVFRKFKEKISDDNELSEVFVKIEFISEGIYDPVLEEEFTKLETILKSIKQNKKLFERIGTFSKLTNIIKDLFKKKFGIRVDFSYDLTASILKDFLPERTFNIPIKKNRHYIYAKRLEFIQELREILLAIDSGKEIKEVVALVKKAFEIEKDEDANELLQKILEGVEDNDK